MSWCRHNGDLRRDPVLAVDLVDKALLNQWSNRIGEGCRLITFERRLGGVTSSPPAVVFKRADEMAGIGEDGDKLAVLNARVPAYMVAVQMWLRP